MPVNSAGKTRLPPSVEEDTLPSVTPTFSVTEVRFSFLASLLDAVQLNMASGQAGGGGRQHIGW